MTAPLCSVLIPSRGRFDRLLASVRSVIAAAAEPPSVEFLVRFDDDDRSSLDRVAELPLAVRTVIGPRGRGYLELGQFYAELAGRADAPWIWIMNDDATIVHEDRLKPRWDVQLENVARLGNAFVHPEVYQLGRSRYSRVHGAAFPIVPTWAWREPSLERLGYCGTMIDTFLYRELCGEMGWPSLFLHGIAVVHDRDDDATLAEHRKFT